MPLKLGDAFLYLRGDDSNLENDIGRAEGRAKGILGRMGGMMQGAMSFAIGGLIVRGIDAITGSIGGLANGMIQGNAEFERYETQFGVLLGSTEAAKERLDELAKFGASTPFELPEVVQADKVLQGFGLHSEEAAKKFGFSGKDIRTIAGDVASGTGTSFQEMANYIGKFSAGATGEVISRFQELGITTRDELKGLGLEFSKSGELLSPLPEATQVVLDLMKRKYGGMMDAQSRTFEGMMSNLADWKAGTLRTIGAPIFEVLKDKLGTVLEFLNRPETQAAINGFANALATGIGQAIDWITGTGVPAIQQGMAFVGQAIDFARPYVETLIATISGLLPAVQDGVGQAGGFIQGVIGAVTAFWQANGETILGTAQQVWGTVQNVVTTVLPQVQAIVMTVFGAVKQFIADHGDEIIRIFQRAWSTIQMAIDVGTRVINNLILPAFRAIAQFLTEHSSEIQAVINTAWSVISTIINTTMTVIQGVIKAISQAIEGDWRGFGETLRSLWEATVGRLVNAIKEIDWLELGKDIIRGLGNGIGAMAGWLGEAARNAARAALDAIKGFLGIRSPSSVAAQQVGRPLAQGIGVGFQDALADVQTSMRLNLGRLAVALQPAGGGFTWTGDLVIQANGGDPEAIRRAAYGGVQAGGLAVARARGQR